MSRTRRQPPPRTQHRYMSHDDVVRLLLAECGTAGGIDAWCRENDISCNQIVHEMLSGRRPVGGMVGRALGLRRVWAYVPVRRGE